MEKSKSKSPKSLISLAALALVLAFACTDKNISYQESPDSELTAQTNPEDEIFTIVEEPPSPKEGGMPALYQYIGNTLRYPKEAKDQKVEGKVFVQFIIDKEGHVTDVEVVRGIGHGCDKEALEVIKNAPDWNPGRQAGKPVNVKMVLPISFKLS